MVGLRCPACRQTIKLDESFAGKRVVCVACGRDFQIPKLTQLARPAADRHPSAARSGPQAKRADKPATPASAAVSPNREPSLLDTARRHRNVLMAGLLIVGMGLAALVMYDALKDPNADKNAGPVAHRSDGENARSNGSAAAVNPQATASVDRSGERSTGGSQSGGGRSYETRDRIPPTTPKSSGQTGKTGTRKRPTAKQPVVPAVTSVRYSSTSGLLLRKSAELNDWLAVAHDTPVAAGTQIVTPRPFDATFDVGQKMYRVRMIGGSSARVFNASDSVPFGFELRRGRLVIEGKRDGAVPGAVLSLGVDGELWRVDLLAGDTLFGLEILPREPQKFEEDFGDNTYYGGIFVVKGSVRLTDAVGMTRVMAGNSWLSLARDDRKPVAGSSSTMLPEPQYRALPDWLDRDTGTGEPKKINPDADLFEESFNRQQAFETAILPALKSSSGQVVEFAVDCLALLGNTTALIEILQTTGQRGARLASISGLRQSMPAGGEGRKRLKDQLRAAFGSEDAGAVYNLLWGYSEDEVRTNQFTGFQLLDWLMHEQTAVRELAWQEMNRHVTAQYGYQPDAAEAARQKSVKLWQAHVLKNGTVLGEEIR